MAAPYRDFWIIVGMTVGAVVVANITAKPNPPRMPDLSTRYQTNRTKPSLDVARAPSTGTEVLAPRATSTEAANSEKATVEQQVRSIDPDIRIAFDNAVQVALANATREQEDQPPDTTNTGSDVPQLETREIRSEPKVFEDPIPTANPGLPFPSDLGIGKTTTNLNMREGPGPKYILIDTLGTGAPLVIMGTEAGWLHVRVTASGREGWVNAKYVSTN
ncbi:SH3 domain-containing protein [Sinorhizobium terangae]|uniref:SH3 domain-containing protein n=1 Tax=Sinorhizobium terangae TaxID=110322 RepID=UPI0024B0E664|nr:SH3 domain-containing protein [Sinorhizobium terangae]WFU50725.1 SH3 domain-containing protein [Sinorhizobium terangae]